RRNTSLMAPGAQMALTGAYFPTSMDQVQVVVNGSAAKVLSTAAGGGKIVAPAHFSGATRAAGIGKARGVSTAAEVVTVVPVDPGLFQPDQDLSVSAGGTLTVTSTGLGTASSPNVTAQFDDTPATIVSVTPSTDSPGVYTLRITAPSGSGKRQLSIQMGGIISNSIPVIVN